MQISKLVRLMLTDNPAYEWGGTIGSRLAASNAVLFLALVKYYLCIDWLNIE